MNAYVYAILVDNVVRYIGKGSGILMKRATEHLRTARRTILRRSHGEKVDVELYLHHMLIRTLNAGGNVEAVLVADRLSHEHAFALEVRAIGQAPSGQLWNISPGGLGGAEVSQETRRKQSLANKARFSTPEARALAAGWVNSISPEKRAIAQQKSTAAKQEPAFKANMAARARERWKNPEKAARMRRGLEFGRRNHSPERSAKTWAKPETRKKFADKIRAKWADPTWKAAQIERLKAAWNTPEGKEKTRKATAARWAHKRKAAA